MRSFISWNLKTISICVLYLYVYIYIWALVIYIVRSFFSSANVSSIVSLNIVSMKYHFFCYLTIINVVRILNLNYPSSNAIIFSLNIIVYFPSSSIFGKSLSRASSALIDMLLCMAFNILNSVLFLFILLSFISASWYFSFQ